MEKKVKGGIAPDERIIHEKAPVLGACYISSQSQKPFDASVDIGESTII